MFVPTYIVLSAPIGAGIYSRNTLEAARILARSAVSKGRQDYDGVLIAQVVEAYETTGSTVDCIIPEKPEDTK